MQIESQFSVMPRNYKTSWWCAVVSVTVDVHNSNYTFCAQRHIAPSNGSHSENKMCSIKCAARFGVCVVWWVMENVRRFISARHPINRRCRRRYFQLSSLRRASPRRYASRWLHQRNIVILFHASNESGLRPISQTKANIMHRWRNIDKSSQLSDAFFSW